MFTSIPIKKGCCYYQRAAILGLGDIGPAPLNLLWRVNFTFKIFAGIDVFDIELDAKNEKNLLKQLKLFLNIWRNKFRSIRSRSI